MTRWCLEICLLALFASATVQAQDGSVEQDPRFVEAQRLWQAGEREASLLQFRRLCEENPRDGERPLKVASWFVQNNHHGAALPFAQVAFQRAVENPRAHAILAVCLVNLNRHKEAERGLVESVRRFPEDARLRFTLGWACLERGSVLEAQKHYDAALELEPRHPLYLFMSGENWMRRCVYEEAERMFRAACEGAPPHPDARWRLGQALGFLERHDEAEEHFTMALKEAEQERRSPHRARYGYALYLFEQGRIEDAEPLLARLVADRPEHRLGWMYLARCQKGLGKFEEARESVARYQALQKKEDAADEAEKLRWFIENELIEKKNGAQAESGSD